MLLNFLVVDPVSHAVLLLVLFATLFGWVAQRTPFSPLGLSVTVSTGLNLDFAELSEGVCTFFVEVSSVMAPPPGVATVKGQEYFSFETTFVNGAEYILTGNSFARSEG